jgi:hypothetical protein
MVLGESHSSSALAEIEVANRLKVLFIVVEAWADEITAKNYRYVFRAGPSNSGVVNKSIAKWVAHEKFKKAFIIAENTDWGIGIGKLTENAVGKIGILAGYFSYLFASAVGLNFVAAMLLAVGLVFLLGILIECTLIRPTDGNEMYSLILTFILSLVLQNAYLLIFGPYPNKPPLWVKGATDVFGLFSYGNQRLAALISGAAVIAVIFFIIKKTWFGRIIRATSQDREMA